MQEQVSVDAAETRALYGQPDERVLAKQLTRLDRHARHFIGLSPFVIVASADAEGRCDATPRGDGPGFVAVLSDTSLAIPDRVGNRRVDTMMNVAANPQVGLIFLVPGIDETLRVNGRARLVRDPALLGSMEVRGRQPVAALEVAVEEVFFHCGKALIRAGLWNPDKQVERASFPSLGRILADQIAGGEGREASEQWIAESYRTRLY